jgi:co-chaperonin GroES (HSP10)
LGWPWDRVPFGRYTGTEISLDSVDHLIIEASDLPAVLHDELLVLAAA